MLAENQQLIPVQRDDLVTSISINGSLVFPNAETASFETQGTLGELAVSEGDIVAAGQPLARLDDDTVSGLEEALAKARYDVSVAEEALAEVRVTYNPLELEQANAKLANAQEAVRVAEDKLLGLLEVTEHEVATAESVIADAMLKISNIEDDIVSLTVRDQREVDDLIFQIETAQVALDNARRDQLLTVEEWAEKVDVAREDVGEAVEEYQTPFESWLGVDPRDVDDSIAPQALLDRWGADLEALFDRSGVDDRLISPPPVDDPATAWDENIIYAFTHLSPYDIRAECDEEGLADPNIFCVLDEMSEAWDKLVDARSALNDLETPATTALSKAEDAVAKAEEAVSDAKDNLADLLEPPDTFALESKQKELAAAMTALEESESDLADLLEKLVWVEVLGVDSADRSAGEGVDISLFTDEMSEPLRNDLLAGQMDVEDALLAVREAEEALGDLIEPSNSPAGGIAGGGTGNGEGGGGNGGGAVGRRDAGFAD